MLHIFYSILYLLTTVFLPGWGVVRWLKLLEDEPLLYRIAITIPLGMSVAIPPIFVLGHFMLLTPWLCMTVGTVATGIFFVMLRLEQPGVSPSLSRPFSATDYWFLVFILLMAVSVGVQGWVPSSIAHGFPSYFDYVKHDGVMFALGNQVLPSFNPFFYPGKSDPLSYYYFFHLLPACLGSVGWMSYANAFSIFSILLGVGFIGCLYAYIRRVLQLRVALAVLAIGWLIAIGGIDIKVIYSRFDTIVSGLDWSSFLDRTGILSIPLNLEYRFPGVLQSLAWVPQHVWAATGFLLIPFLATQKVEPSKFLPIGYSILFCTMGSSVYLGLLLLPITIYYLWQRGTPQSIYSDDKWLLGIWSFFFGILFIWFFWEIRPASGSESSGLSLGWPTFSKIGVSDGFEGAIWFVARLLANILPLIVIILWRWRKFYLHRWSQIVLVLGVLCSLFLHSKGPHNDFGIRILFVVRVFTVLATVQAFSQIRITMKGLGVMGIVALPFIWSNLNTINVYGLERVSKQKRSISGQNQDYFDMVNYLKNETAADAIVQGPWVRYSRLLQLSRRRSILLDAAHGPLLNVQPSIYRPIRAAVGRYFSQQSALHDLEMMKRLGLDYIVWDVRMGIPSGLSGPLYEGGRYAVYKVDQLPSE